MWRPLRSKKEPVCGERIVHGAGSDFGVSSEAVYAEEGEGERERKKARLKYRRFIIRGMGGARGAELMADQLDMLDP